MEIRPFRILPILVTSLVLQGCAGYRSGFSCGDAAGATCAPMDEVDHLISSGEIERVVGVNCRGGKCQNSGGRRGSSSKGARGEELPFLRGSDITTSFVQDEQAARGEVRAESLESAREE